MRIELIINKDLLELIELIAQREKVSVPQFIQDSLESAAIVSHKNYVDSRLTAPKA